MSLNPNTVSIHIIFFLLLDEYICAGYSLEAPHRGASNEYPQHMFLLRNKKDISIFRMKKAPYLLLCCLQRPHISEFIRTWLMLIMLGKKFRRQCFQIFFSYLSQKIGFDSSCKLSHGHTLTHCLLVVDPAYFGGRSSA